MNDVLWFALPGAVLLAAVVIIYPSFADTEAEAAVLLILTPLLGFAVHQLFRLLYEMTGGYARPSRLVLRTLSDLSEKVITRPLTASEAFLVWEITFYSNDFPESFRSHDRGAWHFVMSFWSTAFASLLALVGAFAYAGLNGADWRVLVVLIGAALTAVLFFAKGRLTLNSLLAQEVTIVKRYEELFTKTLTCVVHKGAA